ncbi:SPOSA6832_01035 [Sporobolomyces salmonicolor]|uniref:SPOSA6832_01035-mRNA-1:cds n=1 Tax=Sporidiobolus salmonicolor TaxID=5005 RepID=A0A0D6EHR7_SPOSA|nr:SPOSA6832_01035 [Sporobolomyces salmonicolor]
MAGVFSASRLAGKTVLITGASGGIGAETAILFARAGTNLILTARRQAQLDEVSQLAAKAHLEGGTGKGGQFVTLTLDMQDSAAIKGLLERVPEELRRIDVLVNNGWRVQAGLVFGTDKVGEIDEKEIETMFSMSFTIPHTNVLGLITLTQLMVNEFKKQNSGHIINLGSIAGKEAYAGGSIYCATKHAVSAFNNSLLRELVSTPIRVSQICPGMVETSFSVTRFRGDKEKANKVYEGLQPLVAKDILIFDCSAEEIVWAASRPDHVNIADVLVFPKAQASATINHRGGYEKK